MGRHLVHASRDQTSLSSDAISVSTSSLHRIMWYTVVHALPRENQHRSVSVDLRPTTFSYECDSEGMAVNESWKVVVLKIEW